MHKIFAKTQFLGKNLNYFQECHSTNDFLADWSRKVDLPEGTTIYTDFQTHGRGQRGNTWVSERGKNLMFSFLIRPGFLPSKDQFQLTMITALSVVEALMDVSSKDFFKIKWPNDIYADSEKIGGILIENSLIANSIERAIIGIGINVDQVDGLPENGTSLAGLGSKGVDKLNLLEQIFLNFEKWYLTIRNGGKNEILEAYYRKLLGLGESRKFLDVKKNEILIGKINSVDEAGRLVLSTNQGRRTFDIKEIQFIF